MAAVRGPARIPRTCATLALELLQPFVAGDALAGELAGITREAFNFPAPLIALGNSGRLDVLELFHGPTAAFKDFGARFLAAALTRARRAATRPLKILVATSGDTGGAVAAAFHRPARYRGRGAVSQGTGVADPGAAADLLGRQRAQLRGARTLR